jgi:hypothetical protein
MEKHSTQSGFIALISILIISAVLLATTLGLAQFGIANRFFILNLEQKTDSEKLAEACVQIARIYAYNDPARVVTPADNLYVKLTNGGCVIRSLSTDGSSQEVSIETVATSSDAITNLSVLVDTTNDTYTFKSWREVPQF